MCLIAVISDVHANLSALEAVLADADRQGCIEIWCLGDMVGYGSNPNECVDTLRAREAKCVMGNHDAAVAAITGLTTFNPIARIAGLWTSKVLSEANRDFLTGLPDRLDAGNRCLLVHGAPDDRSRYLWTSWDFSQTAQALRTEGDFDVCFYGHTHIPMVSDAKRTWADNTKARTLIDGGPFLVNPGSVGQPRDGNPDASWLLWDPVSRRIEFRRVTYDIGHAQGHIRAAGLPDMLADRLGCGQ